MFERLSHGLRFARHSGFPWVMPMPAGTPGPAQAIRRRGRRAILRAFPPAFRPLAALLMTCLWPIQSLVTARREITRISPHAFPGRSRAELVLGAWRAALCHNIPPLEFLAYRMPEAPDVPADSWVLQREMLRLLVTLSRPEAVTLSDDKLAFARFCERTGLRAVQPLGRTGAGTPPAEPDAPRVIVKPRVGANAWGIALWTRQADGWRPEGGDGVMSWDALLRHTEQAPSAGERLIQPVLEPHPRLARFGGGGCPAARIVTGLRPDGSVEAVSASFAVPPPGGITSNGGDRRMVDLATGRLLPMGPGRARDVFGDSHVCPELEGLVLPDWAEAVELALAGHRAFPPRAVLLGWDLAFTPDGPVLIETNTGLSFFLEQYESLEPAGTQPGAAVLAAWLT